jgi:cytochrome P450
MLEAGSDTTAVFFQHFLLAMAAYPAAQKKAQEEIDRVIGLERLPKLDDIKDLPYLNALINEVGLAGNSL